MKNKPAVKFELDEVVISPGVEECLTRGEIRRALRRHLRRDWEEDYQKFGGEQFLSLFCSHLRGVDFYVITEVARGITTVLLSEKWPMEC
jgi:hypothetical protein